MRNNGTIADLNIREEGRVGGCGGVRGEGARGVEEGQERRVKGRREAEGGERETERWNKDGDGENEVGGGWMRCKRE